MAETPEKLDEPTPEPTPNQPADDAPTSTKKPAQKTTRSKLQLSREQWIVVILLVLTFELGLRAALGTWQHVATAHLIIGGTILAILIIRAGLRAATNRIAKTSTSRRGRIPGLGRLLGRNATPNANGRTGPRGNRRNPFTGLFGGNRPGGGSGPGGHSRNPLRNLFGGKRPGSASGLFRSHRPDGGSGRRRNPFGRRGGKTTSGNRPGGNRRNPFTGLFGGNRASRAPRSGANGNRPGGGPGGNNRRNPFSGLLGGRPDQPGQNKKPDAPKKPGKKPDAKKPTDQPDDQQEPDQCDQPVEERGKAMTQPKPPANESGVRVPANAGLHLWGRTLPQVEQEANRLKARLKAVEAEIDAFANDVVALATIGETEQVKSTRTVVAQLQAIAANLRRIIAAPASQPMSTIAGQASALWPTYSRDCATDEDRLLGARGTRRQERNADIGRAEADI